jgi:hypothetical protein
MNSLIHLFKELYAYCTDFIINLANITGLSYYEVNFVIFIIIYPLLLIITSTIYVIQRLRLRSIKNPTIAKTKTESKTSFNNIKTFNKQKIFISANLAWLLVIGLETNTVFNSSINYYRNQPPPEDGYPAMASVFLETFVAFFFLSILLILSNIFIFLTTRKTNLPTKLFIKADFFIIPVVLWELFFGFWLLTSLFFFFSWLWIGHYIVGLITLYFTFILLNLRAIQISKYKQTTENASL